MPELTLTEAIGSVKQMENFFKSLKRIEEVLDVVLQLEQKTQELESKKNTLISEVNRLIKKKEETEKGFTEAIEKLGIQFRDEKKALEIELKDLRDKFDKEKEDLLLEIDAIKTVKMNALTDHATVMEKIKIERNEAERTLESIKGELQKIKTRLN
jgi:chromosome segregation ATPase